MLRRLNYDVPAPVLTQYDWCGGTPFDVQRKTVAMMTTNYRAYVLSALGSGKTKSAIWGYDYLRGLGQVHKMLVVATVSTLRFTWEKEIFETAPHLKCVVLTGTKQKRLKLLAEDADIYIINHDGVQTVIDELYKRADIDVLTLDELAVYRNGSSNRTKMMRKYAGTRTWVWGMTGAPIPRGPEGAWGQASIVTPHTVPKYFKHWRDSVMTKIDQFRYIPRENAIERVFSVLQPAVRFTLDDVQELPECIERPIDVPLGPLQAKLYKQMRTTAIAKVSSGEITAMNAGAVLSKLLQISCGYVYARDGTIVTLYGNPRLEMLEECVENAERKVLVFVPFKHVLAGVDEFLKKRGFDHAVVSGDTPARVRGELFHEFQNTLQYRVLLAHPQCLAHGVTLTAADTIIWFAPVTSLEIYEQANAHIRRVGQKHKQQIIKFQGTAAERKVYRLLEGHQNVQNELLGMFADNTL
jgi:SNF2 family DNA or RNA helicase